VSEAVDLALAELGLSADDVEVDVLDEGKSAIFGLLGGKMARVRVTEIDDSGDGDGGGSDDSQADFDGADNGGDANRSNDGGASRTERSDLSPEAAAQAGSGASGDGDVSGDGDGDIRGDGMSGAEGGGGSRQAERHSSERDQEHGRDPAREQGYGRSQNQENNPEAIHAEAVRARAFLQELFSGIHAVVDMDVQENEDGILINVSSDDSGILIGHRGETLDAIQYLANLYLNKDRDSYVRATLDIENYRKKKDESLVKLAQRTAERVIRQRRSFTMDAMNAYERRIIHSELQGNPRIETHSVGEAPNRKVVVALKSKGGYSANYRRY
jgi:spoIIIJ-associated protein